MFQCQVNLKIIIPLFIICLSSLCAFFITEYATQLQFEISNIKDIPAGYKILFKISSSFAAIIPVAIFGFLFYSTQLMTNEVFCFGIPNDTLLLVIGLAFMPMMIFYYFYWINLIYYCGQSNINSVEDFMHTTFVFALTMKDLEFINLVCWALIYLIVIVYFIYKEKPIVQTLISVLLPTAILLLAYTFLF